MRDPDEVHEEMKLELEDRIDDLVKKKFWYHGARTMSGMRYYEELAGPNGMNFILYPIYDKDTEESIKRAKTELRRDRDVVSIRMYWIYPDKK